jgi:hypothetical protein
VGGASASLLPTGVRVSLTTAIKVVVALLQHTTTVRRPAPRTSPTGPLACSLFVLVLAAISHPIPMHPIPPCIPSPCMHRCANRATRRCASRSWTSCRTRSGSSTRSR